MKGVCINTTNWRMIGWPWTIKPFIKKLENKLGVFKKAIIKTVNNNYILGVNKL
jgi:hypothetical protein